MGGWVGGWVGGWGWVGGKHEKASNPFQPCLKRQMVLGPGEGSGLASIGGRELPVRFQHRLLYHKTSKREVPCPCGPKGGV